jgi:thioredoxin-related protein
MLNEILSLFIASCLINGCGDQKTLSIMKKSDNYIEVKNVMCIESKFNRNFGPNGLGYEVDDDCKKDCGWKAVKMYSIYDSDTQIRTIYFNHVYSEYDDGYQYQDLGEGICSITFNNKFKKIKSKRKILINGYIKGEIIDVKWNGTFDIKDENGKITPGVTESQISGIYLGDIKNKQPNGKGVLFYKNEIETVDKNNKQVKVGKYNSLYYGKFKNGKRHGEGVFLNFSTFTRKSGLWENDSFTKETETYNLKQAAPKEEEIDFSEALQKKSLYFYNVKNNKWIKRRITYGIYNGKIDKKKFKPHGKSGKMKIIFSHFFTKKGSKTPVNDNLTYLGEWDNGTMIGKNASVTFSNKKYHGDVVKQSIDSWYKGDKKHIYIGETNDKKEPHGKGIALPIKLPALAYIYYGEWKNGKKQGSGTQFTYNGFLRYEGEWNNNLKNGSGIYWNGNFPPEPREIGYWSDDIHILPDDLKNLKVTKEILGDIFYNRKKDKFKYNNFNDKYILLYFGASWCGSCNSISGENGNGTNIHNKLKEDLSIIYISYDKTEEDFNKYIQKMPWFFIPYKQNSKERSKFLDKFGVQGFPTFIIVNRQKKIIGSGFGLSFDVEYVKKLIEKDKKNENQ